MRMHMHRHIHMYLSMDLSLHCFHMRRNIDVSVLKLLRGLSRSSPGDTPFSAIRALSDD